MKHPRRSSLQKVKPEENIYSEFFEVGANGRLSYKPKLLADKILCEIDVFYDPTSAQLYLWNGYYWELFDERYIEKKCMDYLGVESTKNRVKDAAFNVVIDSTLPHGRKVNDRENWVCLKNCMLNLMTLETRPHSKDFYCTMFLDIEFNPDGSGDCSRWKQFLEETVQTPKTIDQVQEFIGCCLTRDTRYAKCLLAIGPGADGKSVFLKTLRKLVGPENCSAISFHDLEDQFLRSSLYNKLLNISTEVGSRSLESPYFKAIVTGDPISAAFKHKNTFTFTPYCKLAFAVNRLPRVKDNSDGFFRRVLPIEFKRQFIHDADPDLEGKLEAELSKIFEWAIVGLHRLNKQKAYTVCEETMDLLQGYRRLNNPVLCFIEDNCTIGGDYEESKDTLYSAYKKYCSENGYTRFNKNNFFRELYSAISSLKVYRGGSDGARQYRVKGIAVKLMEET